MLDICGKTMLERVIDRTRKAVNKVVVATPDEKIMELAASVGVDGFLGHATDVLDRYYQAAKAFNIKHIARITSDCPMIDPKVIEGVIQYYQEREYDYTSNVLTRTYPKGLDVEIFSFETLEVAWRNAQGEYEREHVTPYIYNHPEIFSLGGVKNNEDLSSLCWTVDYQADLDYVRNIYTKLGGDFTMQDVLKYLGGGS